MFAFSRTLSLVSPKDKQQKKSISKISKKAGFDSDTSNIGHF
jgi:hypothetical protein